jgi:hypothetical protein
MIDFASRQQRWWYAYLCSLAPSLFQWLRTRKRMKAVLAVVIAGLGFFHEALGEYSSE